MDSTESAAFHARLKGTFSGILQPAAAGQAVGARQTRPMIRICQVGEELPEQPLGGGELAVRIDARDTPPRHDRDYHCCGIAYVANVDAPMLIKVYDPGSTGSSCSHNATPTPPRWILGMMQPACITSDTPIPGNRKRGRQVFHIEQAMGEPGKKTIFHAETARTDAHRSVAHCKPAESCRISALPAA